MKEKYLINNMVIYSPDEHRLKPLGRRGQETVLNTPVNRCLLLLLQNPGEVIRQEVIFREVWEKYGQLVTMSTLYQNILLLRRGMRSAGIINECIRTIPKVGVKFIGDVSIVEEEENLSQSNVTVSSVNGGDEETESVKKIEESVESVSNDENILGNVRRRSLIVFFKENMAFRSFLPAGTFIFIASLFTIGPAESVLFFNTHDKISTLNQCSIYVDRGDNRQNPGEIIDFLKGRGLRCDPDEFLYITRTPKGNNILVLFCDTATDGDIQCSTRFNVASNSLKSMASVRPFGTSKKVE